MKVSLRYLGEKGGTRLVPIPEGHFLEIVIELDNGAVLEIREARAFNDPVPDRMDVRTPNGVLAIYPHGANQVYVRPVPEWEQGG